MRYAPLALSLEYVLERADDFSCAACFSSALEALAEIPRLRPDLVLMGIRMPGMSGIECGRRLKEMLSGLVVIFVTGPRRWAKRVGAIAGRE